MIQQVAATGVGGPALSSTTETEALNLLLEQRHAAGSWSTGPTPGPALPTRDGREVSSTTSAGRSTRETVAGKPSAPPFGGHRARRRAPSASTPTWRTTRPKCITVARAPGLVHARHRQPGRQQDRLRRPGGQEAAARWPPLIRAVARRRGAAPAEPVLQRHLHAACSASSARRTRVNPNTHARGRDGPDHRRARRETRCYDDHSPTTPARRPPRRPTSAPPRQALRPRAGRAHSSAGSWPARRSSSCSRSRPTRSSTRSGSRCSTTASPTPSARSVRRACATTCVILTDSLWWAAVGRHGDHHRGHGRGRVRARAWRWRMVMNKAHRASRGRSLRDGDPHPLRDHHRRLGVRLAVRVRRRLRLRQPLVRTGCPGVQR